MTKTVIRENSLEEITSKKNVSNICKVFKSIYLLGKNAISLTIKNVKLVKKR